MSILKKKTTSFFLFEGDSDVDDEELLNVADLDLGATATCSTYKPSNECTKAIYKILSKSWIAACGGSYGVTCIDQFITVKFAFPVLPIKICISNK